MKLNEEQKQTAIEVLELYNKKLKKEVPCHSNFYDKTLDNFKKIHDIDIPKTIMKAKELRLGSWIAFTNSEFGSGEDIVCAIQEKLIITVTGVAVYQNELKPIPITEEWLLKFGFEWVEEECGYFDKHHAVYLFSSGLIEIHPFCTNDTDCHIMLRYVHQLQNLYFALTNEELKLKQ